QSKEAVIEQFKVMGRAIVLEALKEELAQIGVEFDRWYSEQSLYDENLTEAVLNQLDEKGDLGRYDGATWFLSKNYNENLKNEVVIRSDGRPTYFASDIAYHYDKFKRRQFDRVINVWSVDHQGHIPRMGTVMQALALDPARLTILLYNLVKLMRDGKEAKLSKRKGNLVTINDVVSEVGADALRFNLLTRGPQSPIEFDLDLAIAEDNENPVYYVQYGHARICSILNRPEAQGFEESDEEINLSLLAHPSELALIRKLLELEEQILVSAEQLSPHNLTHYSIDLTKTFSGFYRDCKVLDDQQPALSRARLALCRATRVVLAKVLRLIGVNAPESM
ncbi:MAG: arginine--tRNA ligase, partial [Chloroflexota bacterium]